MATSSEQPLKAQLASERERLRAEYVAGGFSQDDYEALREQADHAVSALQSAGLRDGLGSIKAPRSVINAVVRLLTDPNAEVAAPANAEVYEAGLLISRLSRLTRGFVHAPAAWFDRLAALLVAIEAGDERAAASLGLLEFAAACRGAKMPIKPASEASAIVEIDGWKCGAVAVVAANAAGVVDAARAGEALLRELHLPGIIIMEVGDALPPAPRLARVANEGTALAEMRRHMDEFIEPRLAEMAAAVDTRFAFAAFFSAVLSSVIVSSGRAVYAWCPRAANLCSSRDARMVKLEKFMNKLAKPNDPASRS